MYLAYPVDGPQGSGYVIQPFTPPLFCMIDPLVHAHQPSSPPCENSSALYWSNAESVIGQRTFAPPDSLDFKESELGSYNSLSVESIPLKAEKAIIPGLGPSFKIKQSKKCRQRKKKKYSEAENISTLSDSKEHVAVEDGINAPEMINTQGNTG